MSNATLLWLALASWIAFVAGLIYINFFGGAPSFKLPSGNTAAASAVDAVA